MFFDLADFRLCFLFLIIPVSISLFNFSSYFCRILSLISFLSPNEITNLDMKTICRNLFKTLLLVTAEPSQKIVWLADTDICSFHLFHTQNCLKISFNFVLNVRLCHILFVKIVFYLLKYFLDIFFREILNHSIFTQFVEHFLQSLHVSIRGLYSWLRLHLNILFLSR